MCNRLSCAASSVPARTQPTPPSLCSSFTETSLLRLTPASNALLPSSRVWFLGVSNSHAHQPTSLNSKPDHFKNFLSQENLPCPQLRSLQLHVRSLQVFSFNTCDSLFHQTSPDFVELKSSSTMAFNPCTSSCTMYGSSPHSSRIFLSTSVQSPYLCHQLTIFNVSIQSSTFILVTCSSSLLQYTNCCSFLLKLNHLPAPSSLSSFVHVLCCSLILVNICG